MATHVLAGDHIISSDRIPSLTRELTRLGSGASRTAYDLGNGSVLKVSGAWNQNSLEVEMWNRIQGSGYEEYFAEIIAYDEEAFRWVIQRKADRTAEQWELDEFVSEIGYELDSEFGILCDLHPKNLGVIEDSEGNAESYVIIDYALSDNRPSPTCDCGDIDCPQCGCGARGECYCPTFVGHNEAICWVSDCYGDAVFRINLPTWFAQEISPQGACCKEHKPIGHRTGKELRRIAGQGTLGI